MKPSTANSKLLHLVCFILSCFFIPISSQAVVNLKNSQIMGKTVLFDDKEVQQYLGIPYAEPPVGALRFRKPVPVRHFPNVFLAYNVPPACWQRSEYPYPWYDAGSVKSEDCLYLNIWTPSTSGEELKAVIYYVHGGVFRYGSNAQSVYQAAPLAVVGDVVVVTVNYRLGPFGFLESGTKEAPGNVGLWDILQGLKWVNENIHIFGGDKSRITLAGQGAGSVSVGLLSVSPLAKDLFLRQIMESGAPLQPEENDGTRNRNFGQVIAQRLLCANDTFTLEEHPKEVVSCLKKVPADGLSEVHAGINPHFTSTFTPRYGDELLPENPRDAILKEEFTCKDVLIGTTRDEGSYMLTTLNPNFFGVFGEVNPRVPIENGRTLIEQYFSNFSDPSAVTGHYLPDDLPNGASVRHRVYSAMGDKTVNCPTTFYAEKCAKTGNVYAYQFDYRPSATPWAPWMGVVHYSDVAFVFGAPLLHPDMYTQEEMRLSMGIIKMWTRFAKTGKPTEYWPLYSEDNPLLKRIGSKFSTDEYSPNPHKDDCDFFRPYFGF